MANTSNMTKEQIQEIRNAFENGRGGMFNIETNLYGQFAQVSK